MAQVVDKWEYATWIIVTCLLLLIAAIVLYVGIWYYRRRWLDLPRSSSQPWTLEDLRKLRDRGTLTEEEYEAMRAAMIDAYRPGAPSSEEKTPKTDNGDSGDNGLDFDLKKSPQG